MALEPPPVVAVVAGGGGGVCWTEGDEGTFVKNENSLVWVLLVVAGEAGAEAEGREGGEAGPGADLERFIEVSLKV